MKENQKSNPSPEAMVKEAEREKVRKVLYGYSETIRVLRDEKNFSYREIADWMNARGMCVDHNSVYRVYSKSARSRRQL